MSACCRSVDCYRVDTRAYPISFVTVLPGCLITNGVFRNHNRTLCDVVIRLAVLADSDDFKDAQLTAVRRLVCLGLRHTTKISKVRRLMAEAVE